MKKESRSEVETTLRQKAETLIKRKSSKRVLQLSEFDAMKLVHELEVHQIELELQNEELLKAKEKAAELATEKYAELYDFAPTGYFTLSKGGDIVELNLCGSQMLGKERSLLKKRRFGFFVSDDTKPIFYTFLEKVFNSKIKETCELRLLAEGNSPVYAHLTGIATDNGTQCLVIIVDITEINLAEIALRKSEERQRFILESLPIAIYSSPVDADFDTTWISGDIKEITGFEIEEYLSEKDFWRKRLHPEDKERVLNTYINFPINGEAFLEYRWRCKDDQYRWFLDRAVLLENESRKEYLGVIVDINERKQMEEALKVSEAALSRQNELFSFLLKNLQIGVFMVEAPSGKPLVANEMALNLLGRGILPDVSKLNLSEVYKAYKIGSRIPYPPEEMPIILGISGKSAHVNDMMVVRPDGSEVYLEIFGSPVMDNQGKIWASLVSFFDITERKRAEEEIQRKNEELQKINAEKDKFFSIIAHDLRSPFTGFLGLTEIMAEGLPHMTLEEIHNIAIAMRNSATNLFRLLGNLLEWSRMQRGLTTFEPALVLLMPKISESTVLAIDAAKNKEIAISFDIPEDLEVFADIEMLDAIIRNLMTNAVKFTTRGGNIMVSAKPVPDNMVEISIMDSGIGMCQNMINNLFHLDINTNRKGTEGESSTGLGLMICKDFIEKNGGEIWVESDEGKGSTFRFTLPGKAERIRQ